MTKLINIAKPDMPPQYIDPSVIKALRVLDGQTAAEKSVKVLGIKGEMFTVEVDVDYALGKLAEHGVTFLTCRDKSDGRGMNYITPDAVMCMELRKREENGNVEYLAIISAQGICVGDNDSALWVYKLTEAQAKEMVGAVTAVKPMTAFSCDKAYSVFPESEVLLIDAAGLTALEDGTVQFRGTRAFSLHTGDDAWAEVETALVSANGGAMVEVTPMDGVKNYLRADGVNRVSVDVRSMADDRKLHYMSVSYDDGHRWDVLCSSMERATSLLQDFMKKAMPAQAASTQPAKLKKQFPGC